MKPRDWIVIGGAATAFIGYFWSTDWAHDPAWLILAVCWFILGELRHR